MVIFRTKRPNERKIEENGDGPLPKQRKVLEETEIATSTIADFEQMILVSLPMSTPKKVLHVFVKKKVEGVGIHTFVLKI